MPPPSMSVSDCTVRHAENSEVSFVVMFRAVAVTSCPGAAPARR
jgi:hypothetical protein